MHIAFLTPEYPHARVATSAGIGTSIKNLIQGIKDVKGSHTAVSGRESLQQTQFTIFIYGQKETSRWREDGINFHLIRHKQYRIGGFYRYRKHINSYVSRVVKEDGIDLIEAPEWTGITAFMRFSVPLVLRLHGSDTYFCDLEGRVQKKKNFFLEKKAIQQADAITSVSDFTAAQTARLFRYSKPMRVIHNAIDVHFFSPSNTSATSQSILYFGSIIRKKGVLDLATAFNNIATQNRNTQLIFLGKDVIDVKTGISTIKLIKERVGASALQQLRFVSQVPYQDVKKYISEATVVCLPSHAEAFPMTWLEAMAMEKPLVTSNIGWAPEIMVHEKTGLMVNPSKTKDLAKALAQLLTHPEKATRYGKYAREHLITHFGPKNIAEQNLEFYKKVMQS